MEKIEEMKKNKKIKLNLEMEALNLEYFNFKPIKIKCKLCDTYFTSILKNGMRVHPEPYSFSPPIKKRMNEIILYDNLLTKIETLSI